MAGPGLRLKKANYQIAKSHPHTELFITLPKVLIFPNPSLFYLEIV